MNAMGAPDPPRPPRLVGGRGVLWTGRIPGDIFGGFSDQFRVIREKGGPLSAELRSRLGLHAFLGHIISGVDPALGLERLTFLGFDWDGTVHILH